MTLRRAATLLLALGACFGPAACLFDEAGAGGDLGRADATSTREGGQGEAGTDARPDGPSDARGESLADAPGDGGLDSQADGDASADTLSLDTTVDTLAPDTRVDTLSPDTSVDTLSPDTSVDTLSPDTSVDTLSPDTSVDTLSPDATVDSSVDQGVVSCTSKYGAAPGFVFCSETPTSCTFKVSSGGRTCQEVCTKYLGSCLGGRDNFGNCTPFGGDSCFFQYQGQICTCSR